MDAVCVSRCFLWFVQINSETDFVARNDVFQDLVRRVSARALDVLPSSNKVVTDVGPLASASVTLADGSSTTVGDAVIGVVAKVRENVVLRRGGKLAVPSGNGFLAAYVTSAGTWLGRGDCLCQCVCACLAAGRQA